MIQDPPGAEMAVPSELMAFETDILAGALRLSGDENEARQLAGLTFCKAMEAPRDSLEGDLRPWLFSVMRSVFNSVERQRAVRRERGFTANSRQVMPAVAA